MKGGGVIPKAPLIGPTFQELGELSSKTSLRQELPLDFGMFPWPVLLGR